MFVRNDLSNSSAAVKVEIDWDSVGPDLLEVALVPENFEGRSYAQDRPLRVRPGDAGDFHAGGEESGRRKRPTFIAAA